MPINSMCSSMVIQFGFGWKLLNTYVTVVRLYTVMHSGTDNKAGQVIKRLLTEITSKWLITSMTSSVDI
jgi:hypothetical protein